MALNGEPLHLETMQYSCWQQLFDMNASTVVHFDQRYPTGTAGNGMCIPNRGKGLEISFDMMVALAAVVFPLRVDGGVLFVGYRTVLVPIRLEEDFAQFHLFTKGRDSKGQINPHTMDLGEWLKVEDFRQFKGMRCFLGWCANAQINLGTEALPANSVTYTGARKVEASLSLRGLSLASQFGASAPLAATLGLQANFEYTGHRLQFQPDEYEELLLISAQESA